MQASAAIAIVVTALPTFAQAGFRGLGDLEGGSFSSLAYAVSSDGSVVVGIGHTVEAEEGEGFRWTPEGGMEALGFLPGGFYNFSWGRNVSADGSAVVGQSRGALGSQAIRWTDAGGLEELGDLPGGEFNSLANAVSMDGSIVVGLSGSASGTEAFRWTSTTGMVGLGDLPGGLFNSRARDVSADGSVVVGVGVSAAGTEAFRWTSATGMVGLGDLPGGEFYSNTQAVSPDGSVVVGWSESASGREATRWTSATGLVGLGELPGGEFLSIAYGVSSDGSRIVGTSSAESDTRVAFIWDEAQGIRNLQELLESDYGLDLTGWRLRYAMDISADGRTIVGRGINPDGFDEAWIATLAGGNPESPRVEMSDGNVTISWPAGRFDRLQVSSGLVIWVDIPGLDASTTTSFTEPVGNRGTGAYYRLIKD